MKAMLTVVFGLSLVIPSLATPPKEPPDPVLVALKASFEKEFHRLEPKPTFEFPHAYVGRQLIVRFKTRQYDVHPQSKVGFVAEDVVKREGPSDDGFLLTASIQSLGGLNQLVTPQTVHEPYWSAYVNVYPVKNTQKQIYFWLAFRGRTDKKVMSTIMKIASQLNIVNDK